MNNSEYAAYLRGRSLLGAVYRRFYLYPKLGKFIKGRILDIGCGVGDFLAHDLAVELVNGVAVGRRALGFIADLPVLVSSVIVHGGNGWEFGFVRLRISVKILAVTVSILRASVGHSKYLESPTITIFYRFDCIFDFHISS